MFSLFLIVSDRCQGSSVVQTGGCSFGPSFARRSPARRRGKLFHRGKDQVLLPVGRRARNRAQQKDGRCNRRDVRKWRHRTALRQRPGRSSSRLLITHKLEKMLKLGRENLVNYLSLANSIPFIFASLHH